VPRAARAGKPDLTVSAEIVSIARKPFVDPDPWGQLRYRSTLDARRGISEILGRPLAKLSQADLGFIDGLVAETMDKGRIAAAVREHFNSRS